MGSSLLPYSLRKRQDPVLAMWRLKVHPLHHDLQRIQPLGALIAAQPFVSAPIDERLSQTGQEVRSGFFACSSVPHGQDQRQWRTGKDRFAGACTGETRQEGGSLRQGFADDMTSWQGV